MLVCERWQDWRNFVADMGEPFPGAQIDRIDNDKGYSPDNCRWVDRATNNRNKRTNRWFTINGERRVLRDWCAAHGISEATVYARLARGWGIEKALTTPPDQRVRSDCVMIEAFGSRLRISDWARKFGIDRKVISYRLRAGWSAEEAVSTSTANNGYAHGRRRGRLQS